MNSRCASRLSNEECRRTSSRSFNSSKINLEDKRERRSDDQEKIGGWKECSPCLQGCIIASLISGVVLALIITLWFLNPSKNSSMAIGSSSSTMLSSSTTTSSSSTMFSSSTTTSSSTTSSSSTSVSTSTTTIPAIGRITASGDFIIAIFNTSAGQSTGGYNGTFLSFEGVEKAIDGQLSTKYVNYGYHQFLPFFSSVDNPGVDTGFIVTPTRNVSSVACGLLFATGNDCPERDPLTVTLEGTNATSVTALNDGASWTLIYSGPTGMELPIIPPRSTYVAQQNFSNTIPFRSYRLLVTSQRNKSNSVQYAEAHIMGYF